MIKKLIVFAMMFSLLFAFGCGRNKTDVLPVVTTTQQPEYTAVIPQDDSFFCGNWYATSPDADGNPMALILDLRDDGKAVYKYGMPESELLEYFEGTWEVREGLLCLDLIGGPVGSEEMGETETESYDFCASFEWEMAGDSFVITHVDGNPFLFGTDGGVFIFQLMG